MYTFVLSMEDCDIHYFQFLESKNNLVMKGVFTKIVYTHPNFSINSIYIRFPIIQCHMEKNFLIFDTIRNKELFIQFCNIELDILKNYNIRRNVYHKTPVMAIANMFYHGRSKLANFQNTSDIFIKLSGIWESDTEYGITYKLVSGIKL